MSVGTSVLNVACLVSTQATSSTFLVALFYSLVPFFMLAFAGVYTAIIALYYCLRAKRPGAGVAASTADPSPSTFQSLQGPF